LKQGYHGVFVRLPADAKLIRYACQYRFVAKHAKEFGEVRCWHKSVVNRSRCVTVYLFGSSFVDDVLKSAREIVNFIASAAY